MLSSPDILGAKILIVDDQESNVTLLELLLDQVGYTSVTSTMDPLEVCALHRKNRYDLILLDLQMPGMDGFQVMEALKTNDADSYLPVIVLTAQPDLKLRALKAGAKDFMSKPFDLAEVETRVHNMLEVRLSRNAAEKRDLVESRRKSDFLATLAHELRNPLAPIRNGLEILKMSSLDDAGVRARDIIDRQVSQMVYLVNDLMECLE